LNFLNNRPENLLKTAWSEHFRSSGLDKKGRRKRKVVPFTPISEAVNHRIVRIEELARSVAVYDLHIADVNNFIVNELCVHNSSPNFQNLPAGRNKAAKEIKNMFQAEPPSKRWREGTCLIQVDYAAAEVFWAVNFSNEPELVKFLNACGQDLARAYENSDSLPDAEFEKIILSTDFHKRTASLMFEIPPEQVSKSMRQESKSITFGLLYGKTVQGLASDNGWTVEEAEAKMRKFFSAFPRLERWPKSRWKRLVARGMWKP
jgi:hypothetical protein